MSESERTEAEADDGARPWHGSSEPWEALYQWVKAELEKLKPAADASVGKKKWTPPPDAEPAMAHVEAPVIVDAPKSE